MKIVHLCLGNFFIDNYAYQENLLTKYHVILGHDVTVIASLVSFDKNGKYCLLPHPNEYLCKDGYKVYRIDFRPFLYRVNKIFRRFVGLRKILNREDPDIIFIHNCQFWDIRVVKEYAIDNPHLKIFVDNHADYINSASNWLSYHLLHRIVWRYCAKQILPYTTRFYGVLPIRCDFLMDMYKIPSNKVELLVMGVDNILLEEKRKKNVRRKIRDRLGVNKNTILIITGGKIDQKKNIHHLMKVVADLSGSDIKLLLFGNISPDIKESILRLSEHSSIEYIGWISLDEILDYYLASDLAFFPGTHSVLWEQAVGSGLPCVFKYWEGITHVDVGGNVLFLNRGDESEIKGVLIKILSDIQILERMASIASEEGLKRFSYSHIAKNSIKNN